MDPKEIGILVGISTSVVGNLNALDAQRIAFLNANHGAAPSAHFLNQFDVRRQQVIMSGVRYLSERLTPPSWDGLHSYITRDYRINGSVLPIGGK